MAPLAAVTTVASPVASAGAQEYLSIAEAQKLAFPEAARFVEAHVVFRASDIAAIEQRSRQKVRTRGQQVWRALAGERVVGFLVVDYVIGKHLVIDYAVAEITFTPTKLISRVSRIVVDFEYTDRQFNRSLLALKSENSFSNRRLTLNASVLEENDNEDSPIDITLSDSDKAILRSAGNDRLKAVRSGAVLQGPGKGQYIRKDTTVASPSGPDTAVPYREISAAMTFPFSGLATVWRSGIAAE